jgi:hypothetical protein
MHGNDCRNSLMRQRFPVRGLSSPVQPGSEARNRAIVRTAATTDSRLYQIGVRLDVGIIEAEFRQDFVVKPTG